MRKYGPQTHSHQMSRLVLSRSSGLVASDLLRMSMDNQRHVVGLLNGHCTLGLHLHRI